MAESLAIIDYGSGNLRSVEKAVERAAREAGLARHVSVTDDPDLIRKADRIILPGVGAFAACMEGLAARNGVLEAIGGTQRGYGLVFSGMDADGSWITRFETVAAPSAHIADVFFGTGDSQESHETIIQLSDGSSAAWLLLPLTVMGAAALRRRREAGV